MLYQATFVALVVIFVHLTLMVFVSEFALLCGLCCSFVYRVMWLLLLLVLPCSVVVAASCCGLMCGFRCCLFGLAMCGFVFCLAVWLLATRS